MNEINEITGIANPNMSMEKSREPKDFVNDMLVDGVDWLGILAVARCIRNGSWYEKVKTILQERKLMPSDDAEILKQSLDAKARYKNMANTPPPQRKRKHS